VSWGLIPESRVQVPMALENIQLLSPSLDRGNSHCYGKLADPSTLC